MRRNGGGICVQSSFLSLQFRKLRPREKNFKKNMQELSGNLELEPNVQTLSSLTRPLLDVVARTLDEPWMIPSYVLRMLSSCEPSTNILSAYHVPGSV